MYIYIYIFTILYIYISIYIYTISYIYTQYYTYIYIHIPHYIYIYAILCKNNIIYTYMYLYYIGDMCSSLALSRRGIPLAEAPWPTRARVFGVEPNGSIFSGPKRAEDRFQSANQLDG